MQTDKVACPPIKYFWTDASLSIIWAYTNYFMSELKRRVLAFNIQGSTLDIVCMPFQGRYYLRYGR